MAVEKLECVDEKVLHNFAKRLANNEPRLRKNAMKKLKGWMEARSGNMKSKVVLLVLYFAEERCCAHGWPCAAAVILHLTCVRGKKPKLTDICCFSNTSPSGA